jgi:hypothetical protein
MQTVNVVLFAQKVRTLVSVAEIGVKKLVCVAFLLLRPFWLSGVVKHFHDPFTLDTLRIGHDEVGDGQLCIKSPLCIEILSDQKSDTFRLQPSRQERNRSR